MLGATLIIALLLGKILLIKLHPRIGVILDLIIVLLFLIFKIALGKAEIFSWTFIILYFLGGIGLSLSNRFDTLSPSKIS